MNARRIAHSESNKGAVTRRAFLAAGGAAALSFFLPSIGRVGDGFAYAIETGVTGADGQPEFDIYVITREDMGISVVDLTNNTKAPVGGAQVTLVSSKTKAEATATADENGLVVFNLKETGLGVPMKLEGIGDGYRFEGSIKTSVPGQDDVWMDFETGRMRANGGTAVQTPLRRRANQTDPFFTMLSFDGWDILYTANNTISTPYNYDDHTFAGKLYMPNGGKAEIKLVATASGKDDIVIFKKTASVVGNVVEFSQTANYLYLNNKNKNLLPDGRNFVYRVTVNGTPYQVAVKFSVRQAPVPEPKYTVSSMSPSEQSLGSFSLPSDIPAPLGGSSMSVWCPILPFSGWISPQGYAFFAATLSANVTNTASFANSSDWKGETCGSALAQIEELSNTWSKSLEKFINRSNLLDPSASVKDKFNVSKAISLDITAQVYSIAEWDFDAKIWKMSIDGLVNAALAFSFTAQTTIGPVPVFLIFKLGLAGKVTMSTGQQTSDFEHLEMTRTTGLGFTITTSIALTLGVGVPGVASAGLRGSGYLAFYVGFDNAGVVPHMAAGFALSADVVIQVLLFTWTGKLWSYKKDPFYDNSSANLLQDIRPDLSLNPTEFALGTDSNGKPIYSNSAPFDPTKGLDFDEFVKQSTIVTEQTLNKTAEMKGARNANAAALLASEPAPSVTRFDNGIVMVDLSAMAASAAGRLAANAAEPTEFDYEYIGEDLDAVCNAVGGVAGIASSGGVEPTVDKKIATRIFGGPKCKVVIYLDTPYLFRLISVSYDDDGTNKTRTRLAVQRMNANGKWTTPRVLEFRGFNGSGMQRIDSFDYDFDVYANESATTGYVSSGMCVVLLSGSRPQGDDTDFFNVSNSTVMSVGVFDAGLLCATSYSWKTIQGDTNAPYQAFMLPRITTVSTGTAGANSMGLALLYMRRTANSIEQLFGNDAQVTAEFGYMAAEQIYLGGRETIDPSSYDFKVFDNGARGTNEASFSFAVQSDAGMSINTVFPYRNGKALTAETAPALQSGVAASSMNFNVKHNVKNAAGLENSQPWPRRSAILVPEDGILTALSFDPTAENGTFEKTQIGPQNEKISTFLVSPTGETLFYPVNQDGEMPESNGESAEPSTVKVSQHTIYACALVDDLFSRPFPLANTSHAIDALENAYSGGTYSFIATCITNMANNSADIYYINVPAVATATPVGFVPENAFVCAGLDDEPFLMELRNDGNVILNGCTVELRDADRPEPNNIVDTRVGYRFANNLTGSIWNPELLASASSEAGTLQAETADENSDDKTPYSTESLAALGVGEDHVLVNPSKSGALLPGYSGQYRITFDIPASWTTGHKNVYITMKDFMYDTLKLGEGIDDVLQYPSSLDIDNAHRLEISTGQPNSGTDSLGDAVLAPATPTSDTPTPGTNAAGGGQQPSSSVNAANDSQKKLNTASLVQSGDSAALSLVGLAATAVVAGVTAYSARRAANEQEQAEKDATE